MSVPVTWTHLSFYLVFVCFIDSYTNKDIERQVFMCFVASFLI